MQRPDNLIGRQLTQACNAEHLQIAMLVTGLTKKGGRSVRGIYTTFDCDMTQSCWIESAVTYSMGMLKRHKMFIKLSHRTKSSKGKTSVEVGEDVVPSGEASAELNPMTNISPDLYAEISFR